jgi:hypothetical protein
VDNPLTYVPKLKLRDPMRNCTITRLGNVWPKEVFDLSGRRTRIILAPETRPVGNEDRNANARRIARARVPQEKGLARAVAGRRRERGDGVARDCIYVGERSVDGNM